MTYKYMASVCGIYEGFCYLMKNFNSPHYSSLLQNPYHITIRGILLMFYDAKLKKELNIQEI